MTGKTGKVAPASAHRRDNRQIPKNRPNPDDHSHDAMITAPMTEDAVSRRKSPRRHRDWC